MGAALAQQVPVAIELDLDGVQALVLLVCEPLVTLARALQLVLFGDECLDVILDPRSALVILGPPRSLGDKVADRSWTPSRVACAAVANPAIEIDAAGRSLRVSNPERVIFPPTDGTAPVTKLQVVEYYLAVAPGIMRALRERPTTLERWPKGVHPGIVLSTREKGGGDAFFQKRIPRGAPPMSRRHTSSSRQGDSPTRSARRRSPSWGGRRRWGRHSIRGRCDGQT